ncbi:MAG: NAD(P)/FAD-dependent oxidoreductase [Planctomycetaceae bacterium]
MEVTIVGAGIVGAAIARALAREGSRRVTVCEARFPGGGATAAGMGHLVVIDDSPTQLALTARGRALWADEAARLPRAAEYRQTGTLWVAADDEEMADVVAKARRLGAAGIGCDVVDGPTLARREPALRNGLAGALSVPDDAVVYAPPVAAAWLAEAVAAGATVRRDSPVVAVDAPGRVRFADGTLLDGDAVVIATGAAAAALLPGVPVRPRKGHLVITDRVPGMVRSQLVELGYVKRAHDVGTDSVAFNVQPRATGQLLVGSSRQIDVADRAIDEAMLGRMLARCLEFMPALAGVPAIRAWVGLRAATPDGLPLVGPWPGAAGIWLATGHEGLGITTAPATAETLVGRLRGRSDPLAAALAPARFGGAFTGAWA